MRVRFGERPPLCLVPPAGTTGLRTPEIIRKKLDAMGTNYTEVYDQTIKQHEELIADQDVDLVYLPGCSVKMGDPGRDDFMKKMQEFYITVDGLTAIQKKRTAPTLKPCRRLFLLR